jgi:acetyl esterase/lipase
VSRFGLAHIATISLAVIGCLLALPVIVTFDSLLLWKVTLGVTEYGHRVAVLLIPIALLRWKVQRVAATALLIAGCVVLMPLMQAVSLARHLPGQMEESFRIQSKEHLKPLSVSALFFGGDPAPVVMRQLIYARDGAEERRAFFHPAQGRNPAPCVIVIHSGGWENGRPDEFPTWNWHWASRGFAVAAIQYRLAPKHQWPAQRDDVATLIAHLKENAAALGVDATRIILIGRSAGAQIATAAAYSLRDPAIKGCVSLYGPTDMFYAWRYADPNDVLDSPRLIRQYLGGSAEEAPENYRSASGTLLADRASPPTLVIHGNRDVLVWRMQSLRLAASLRGAEVPHHYLALPWATHALDFPFNGPGAQLTRYAMDVFLDYTAQ